MIRTISIFGGGISGLTIAHELIERGFKVIVYELTNTIGGMAKSIREPTINVPTEHSWRGYWPFYKNCFDILKRIPRSCYDRPETSSRSHERKNQEKYLQNNQKFTLEEVSKHTSKENGGVWTYYKGNVYNITNFGDKLSNTDPFVVVFVSNRKSIRDVPGIEDRFSFNFS